MTAGRLISLLIHLKLVAESREEKTANFYYFKATKLSSREMARLLDMNRGTCEAVQLQVHITASIVSA